MDSSSAMTVGLPLASSSTANSISAREKAWAGHATTIAFVAAVVGGISPSLLHGAGNFDRRAVGWLGCAGAFLALGVAYSWLQKKTRRPILLTGLYFAAQLALLSGVFYFGRLRGSAFVLILPLVGHAVAQFKPRVAAVWVAVFLVHLLGFLWAFGGTRALKSSAGPLVACFVFTIGFTRIAVRAGELAEQLAAANMKLEQQQAEIATLAEARERNRLAREIHDSLGHYLTTLAVQLDVARKLPGTPVAADAIEKAHRLSGQALDEVRVSVRSLREEAPALALVERVRELVALSSAGEWESVYKVEGLPRRLRAEVEHTIFRGVQEGLTNVRKHGRAKRVWITLDFREPSRMIAEIANDGFEIAKPAGQGFGLSGLAERCAVLGGTMSAAPRTGGGFVLRFEVPT